MSTRHVKELFSQTAIYGIGLVVNKVLSFVLLPLFTYYYSPAELGAYNIVQSIWFFLILFYLYGQETAFIKFFIDEKVKENKTTIYSTTLVMLFVSSILFSLIIYIIASPVSKLINFEDASKGLYLLKLLAVVLFTDSLFRFPLLLMRAELKAQQYLWMTILSVIINIAANFYFIAYLKIGIESIFYSYIISVIVTFIAGFILTSNYFKFTFSFEKAKKLIVYGNKFIYIGIFILLIDLSDRFFLKYFFNEEIVGIYSANYRLASVMALVITAFRFSWTPYFLNLEKNPENKNIISNIFTYLIAIGMILFLFFSFFTEPIVKISFGNFSLLDVRYQSGLTIIPIILMAYFFSGIYAALSVAPFYANKTIELFYVSLFGFICNTIFNLILIPNFNMSGAAYSTLITYILMFIYLYIRSQKIYKINFETKKGFFIFFTGLLFFAINHITKNYVLLNNNWIISVVLIIFFLFILYHQNLFSLTTVKTIFRKAT